MTTGGRVTVHDLARAAGVSLATVDRVLNGRPGVRQGTIDKVEAAIAEIGFRRDLTASMLARARDIGIAVIVPEATNQFFGKLAEAVETIGHQMRAERLRLDLTRIRAMDTRALVAALDVVASDHSDCAVIVAIDKPEVHAAVARAAGRGIRVITLVSDLPGSARQAFVGIDNRAAGRTAASLMGRFLPQGGMVGLVAGSLELIDHAERVEGFREVAEAEFPAIAIAGPIEGQDEFTLTYERTLELLTHHPDLSGLYNAGAGNAGMLMALNEKGLAGKVRVIGHELTGPTRAGLESGAVDLVLDQSPEDEIRAVCAAARRLVLGPDAAPPAAPIEIKVFLRDNLR
ncbi:LacI family DNA-binding transcriptional regulator [Pelagibacterium sp. H642]|uniref:LacI family DNA-binding transcriptional regulator n=1 Tax=Pelagibacterium sp. H642 TaxID=1881069 RepID=UPI002814E231|nr:LacI family DNA-binding transcriptional regulator [Pelagibacterium sp. H642]WMT92216.1 LacI family DNA-binding transcriptional regulator [Pelagibacterium sp. H642]